MASSCRQPATRARMRSLTSRCSEGASTTAFQGDCTTWLAKGRAPRKATRSSPSWCSLWAPLGSTARWLGVTGGFLRLAHLDVEEQAARGLDALRGPGLQAGVVAQLQGQPVLLLPP